MRLPHYDKSSLAMKRKVVTAPGAPTPMAHYCHGVMAGDTVYAAGQIASDYRTGVPPEARQDAAFPYYGSDIQKQARYILNNLRSVFKAAGCNLKDVVKSQVFLTDLKDFYYFDQVWKEFFPSPPPRTTVQVSGLLVPGCRVEIDLTAVLPGVARRGRYPEAILAGETLYAAGQIAADSRGGVPSGSDMQNQTRYVLNNLHSVLKAAGCDLKDVVKAQVFLTDLNDFPPFDEVWKEFFASPPPRTALQVSGLLVPGCRIEIDLTAVLPGVARRSMYSEAILAGETLYAAGQIAADSRGGVAPAARHDPAFPYYGSDIQKQTRHVLNNLRSAFKTAGCDLKDVVKSQVFLTDLKDFYYFDQVWKEFFPSPPPRTTVQVSGLAVPGCRVEIDLTAVLP
jgi:reactive intermediate/imine deaminase